MLLTRLYLRNFRVFEDELDLALPPGLVGIYGPNGAGKSTLLEAISYTLWGRARTGKDDIRTAGVGGDCITELEFEHEGHLYVVRRRLTGISATPRASVVCDGLQITEGAREVGRYLHSLLGMDDGAFRASVFAEQKQLAAFSAQTPDARRQLVLKLLGVTPLDAARDAARRDARVVRERHDHLRGVLPDVDALRVEAGDAAARADRLDGDSATAATALQLAERETSEAAAALAALDLVRQEHEALVREGKSVRAQLDRAVATVAERTAELAALAADAAHLAEAEAAAAGLQADEELAAPLGALVEAATAAEGIVVGPQPPAPDPAHRDEAAAAAAAARAALGEVDGEHRAVRAELDRARAAAARSGELSGEADCPLCGQALGAAWEQVRDHRAAEVTACEQRLASLEAARAVAAAAASEALGRLEAASTALAAGEAASRDWQSLEERRNHAAAAEAAARAVLAMLAPALVADGAPAAAGRPPAALAALRRQVADGVASKRRAAAEAQRLRGRLEGRDRAEAAQAEATALVAALEGDVQALRDKVKGLRFDATALATAASTAQAAAERASAARRSAETARVEAATARAAADAAERRVSDAEAQHCTLADLAVESLHLARVADLLADFRNTVVASVGPRLAVQAAELFAELTDHEYDELQVDPETYGLRISDAGRVFGLERFSGSEVDLANLALRVAISEHVRFQSGGSVGLLVLDEVFGPLDDERKERMLAALERLRGRFRQVLCVTHDSAIKEQLPSAVEVVKLPGRRATARLLAG